MRTLFEGQRLQMTEAMELTITSMRAYGPRFEHWVITWSGGKDSTALLTMVLWMVNTGRVPRPKSITVLYADTRMELPPLAIAARGIIVELREMGIEVKVVQPPMDRRYFVYMFGRGVPTPGAHFRWCTGQIKIAPMAEAVNAIFAKTGKQALLLTGVRQGESAMRDGRIAMSCGKDGAECGQGWFQETLPGESCSALAPLLHWRVCQVWEWLKHWATQAEFGDWDTSPIADAYGGDEAEEINARTGCICCPVASRDRALDAILTNNRWHYLRPLLELRDLYEELREEKHRLHKPAGVERGRKGPLTMDARRYGLGRVLDIQARVNAAADAQKRPRVVLIDDAEHARILELIQANTWPNKWNGTEESGVRCNDELAPILQMACESEEPIDQLTNQPVDQVRP